MDDAFPVSLLEGLGDLLRHGERLRHRDRSPPEAFPEVFALDQLENEEWPALGLLQSVDGGHVRVVQSGEELRLPLETSRVSPDPEPPRSAAP